MDTDKDTKTLMNFRLPADVVGALSSEPPRTMTDVVIGALRKHYGIESGGDTDGDERTDTERA